MSANTTIEWCTKTWNPIRGCSRVSPGCDNCYAMGMAHRFSGPGKPYEGLTTIRRGKVDWSGEARFIREALDEPLRWRKPERVFVNSMSDLFHHSLAFEEIAAIFGVMAACPQHTFLVLTKRPERALEFFEWIRTQLVSVGGPTTNAARGVKWYAWLYLDEIQVYDPQLPWVWPLPNVHFGVSVENQKTADERLPLLLRCLAAVRWASMEPLLEDVDARAYLHRGKHHVCPKCLYSSNIPEETCPNDGTPLGLDVALDWVVVGGESGPRSRPMHIEWMRSIVAQCRAEAVPVFCKQFGANLIDAKNGVGGHQAKPPPEYGPLTYRLKHRKGADLSEVQGDWPREFPRVA